MKKLRLSLLMSFVALLCVNSASAQIDYENDPRYANYGSDAVSREANHRNYVFFIEAIKMNSYDDAEKRLEEIITKAPAGTENVYIRGRSFYLNKIKTANTPEQKQTYIYKLMNLHDVRNKHFGHVKSRGSKEILKIKLLDYAQYNPMSIDNIIKFGDDAIKAGGENVDAKMVAQFFNAVSNVYMQDMLSPDNYLQQYEFVSKILTTATSPNAAEMLKECESIFIQSGAADCTNVERIYKPQYLANPSNVELMKKVLKYLALGACESDFRNEIAEKVFEINPTTSAALSLGLTYANLGEHDKGVYYLDKAIELETSDIEKSKYAVRAAVTSLGVKNVNDAVKFSKKAVASDPSNGLAYFVLAQSYGLASTSTKCEGIAKKSVYWIIVDVLNKAKTLLANDVDQVKTINNQISSYSQHFPTSEDLFFDSSIKEGNSYEVKCGLINGTTIVRAAK